jgi:hypothetical protein
LEKDGKAAGDDEAVRIEHGGDEYVTPDGGGHVVRVPLNGKG